MLLVEAGNGAAGPAAISASSNPAVRERGCLGRSASPATEVFSQFERADALAAAAAETATLRPGPLGLTPNNVRFFHGFVTRSLAWNWL